MARKLIVEIVGDASSFEAALARSTAKTETFGSKLGRMGKTAAVAAGAAGVGALVIGLKDALEAAERAQVAHAKLDTAFGNVGLSAAKYAKQIDSATASGRELGFKNSEILDSLAKLIVPTKNAGKAMDALGIAENLARAKHIDLASASQILAGAFAGNQRAIRQLGIAIPAVTRNVDALKEAHNGLKGPIDAVALAHAKLQDKLATGRAAIEAVGQATRGQSQAFAGTAAGGMAQFSAQLDNLEEQLGNKLLPIMTSVLAFINSNWSTIGTVLTDAFNVAKIAIESFMAPMRALWDLIHGDWSGAWNAISAPAVAAWNAITGVIQPVVDLISGPLTTAMTAIQGVAATVWQAVQSSVTSAFNAIRSAFDTVWKGVETGLTVAWTALSSAASTAWDAIKSAVTTAFNLIKTAYEAVWNAWFSVFKTEVSWVGAAGSAVWDALKTAASTAFSVVKAVWNSVLQPTLDAIRTGLTWIKDHAGDAWDALKSAVQTVAGAISSAINAMLGPIRAVIGALSDLIGWAKDALDWLGKVAAGTGPGKPTAPGPPGMAPGPGRVPAASGGYIPGVGNTDSVPAMLTPGEFVIRKSAARALGSGFLNRINRYAGGGPIGDNNPPPPPFPLTSAVGSGPGFELWRLLVGSLKQSKREAEAWARATLQNPFGLPTPKEAAIAKIESMSGLVKDAALKNGLAELEALLQQEGMRGLKSWKWADWATGRKYGLGVPFGALLPPQKAADQKPPYPIYDPRKGGFFASGGAVSALATGGRLLTDGIYYGHKGETVTPARTSGMGGDIHITLDLGGDKLRKTVTKEMVRSSSYGGPGFAKAKF